MNVLTARRTLVVACLTGLLAFMAGCRNGGPKPAYAGALLSRLDTLQLEPHPHVGRNVEAGSVYVVSDLRSAYPPAEVFEESDSLLGPVNPPLQDGTYQDLLKSGAGFSLTLLKYLGVTASADLNHAIKVDSKIEGLRVRDVRLDVLRHARFKPGFLARAQRDLGPEHLIVVAQSVGTSSKLTLEFKNETGASVSLGAAAKEELSARASASQTSGATEKFENFTFASKPLLRVGGDGSSFSESAAKELEQRLKSAKMSASRDGTLVSASLSWDQVDAAIGLVRSSADAAALRAEADALRTEVGALRDERTRLAGQLDDARSRAEQLDRQMASAQQDLAALGGLREQVNTLQGHVNRLTNLAEISRQALSEANERLRRSSEDFQQRTVALRDHVKEMEATLVGLQEFSASIELGETQRNRYRTWLDRLTKGIQLIRADVDQLAGPGLKPDR